MFLNCPQCAHRAEYRHEKPVIFVAPLCTRCRRPLFFPNLVAVPNERDGRIDIVVSDPSRGRVPMLLAVAALYEPRLARAAGALLQGYCHSLVVGHVQGPQ